MISLIGLAFAFLSTTAAMLQTIGGNVRVERLLEAIHQRLIEIRDRP